MEISYTQLRVYLECPWKYKLQYIDGLRIPHSPNSSFGVSLHRALECFHRKEAGAFEDLLECYDRRWLGTGYPDEETKERWRAKGRRILERYWRSEQERRTEIVGIEREFVYTLGRHQVRGMIDRVDRHADGRCEVIDYKTFPEMQTEAELGDNLQMRFYALGVRESLAWEPGLLTLYYVANDRRVSVPYDPAGEEELKALIERTADRIEAGDFKPDTSFCVRCPFHGDCAHSVARG